MTTGRGGRGYAALREVLSAATLRAIMGLREAGQVFLARVGTTEAGEAVDTTGGADVLVQARELFVERAPAACAALDELTVLARRIGARAPGVTLHFDLCELHGYHYHTGLVFAAYVGGQGEAVANGGRYDDIGRVFGRARPATGFSFDLKTLLGVLPPETAVMPSRGIFVAHELACDAWDEVCRLRDAGERVLTGLPGQRVSACCDRELRRAGAAWRIDTL